MRETAINQNHLQRIPDQGPDMYSYRFSNIKFRDDWAKYQIQYLFSANCLKSAVEIEYALNLNKFGSWLYISDFFPLKWQRDSKCFQKLLSVEENMAVNFKKVSVTAFMIFHYRVAPTNVDASFVISGSYIDGEKPLPGLNYSRKLKLYWYWVEPIAVKYGYKIVEVLDYNAIVLVSKKSKLEDETIRDEYIRFRHR